MKKYYISLLLPSKAYGEKDQTRTLFLDFKEIASEKDVKDMEEKCRYILDDEKWKLRAFSLVGEPSPPIQSPFDFKKSPILESEVSLLKKLEKQISKEGPHGLEWIGKLSNTTISEIKKIIDTRTNVYILPLTLDMGFSVGYQIKQVPDHYPFLKKEINVLLTFSERVFAEGREPSKKFFPICLINKNLQVLKAAEPGTVIQSYGYYEY